MFEGEDIFFDKVKSAFLDFSSESDLDKLRLQPPELRVRYMLEHTSRTETEICSKIASLAKMPFEKAIEVSQNPEKVLPLKLMHDYQCLPLKSDEGRLRIAVPWPPSSDMDRWVYALMGRRAEWILALPSLLSDKIAGSFGVGAVSLEEGDVSDFSDVSDSDIEEDENAAIIKFVNEIISRALSDRATDIHIEPRRESLSIRYRIDGNLVPVSLPENLVKFKDAIISRIKIMSRLNISEKRRPQDGRIAFATRKGEEIDIRVSSLPSMYGESISLRLLNQKSQPVTIEDLGFLPEDEAKITASLSRSHGIILVTGPTGSGKSTTLTAFIRRLRSPEIRIITVEDPVEYEVEGVNQTQVNPEIGLTFSSVLRSVLRQDPDVIMVGEIRDRETAEIAIRASLTGHLVLSTLHTNDAAGALTRLIDMDIEPFLIASSVEMIFAQRLVRRLCSCSAPANMDISRVKSCFRALGIPDSELRFADKIKGPVGCDKCRGLGYFGRVGIFEILVMNDDLHSMIVGREPSQEIAKVASKHGMRTLQECGWELVKKGITGMDEIMYYANLSEEGV